MSKIAIIYSGKYGTTEKYAGWIAEETGADLIKGSEVSVEALKAYDLCVFGGAINTGGIKGIQFLQKNCRKLADKKIICFAVGLNVNDEEARNQCREINFKKHLSDIPCYFLPGAYYPEKINGMDKMVMKMVKKMADGKILSDITNGADYTDRKYIEEIVAAIKAVQ